MFGALIKYKWYNSPHRFWANRIYDHDDDLRLAAIDCTYKGDRWCAIKKDRMG